MRRSILRIYRGNCILLRKLFHSNCGSCCSQLNLVLTICPIFHFMSYLPVHPCDNCESRGRDGKLPCLPVPLVPHPLRDAADKLSLLEVNPDVEVISTSPTHASYLRAGDTVDVEISVNPFLAIPSHLEQAVGRGIEQTDADVVADHEAGACHCCSGQHIRELEGASVPPFVSVEAFLHHAFMHILEIDAGTHQ